MPVVEENEVVVVMVSFAFIPSFSFVLHFVAFSSSSCCGGSGADVEVVVVVADVELVVVVVVCSFPLLASSSSSLSSSFGAGFLSFFAAVGGMTPATAGRLQEHILPRNRPRSRRTPREFTPTRSSASTRTFKWQR